FRRVLFRSLARARSLRHVRRHVPWPPGPAAHPDVGDVRRGLPAAEGFPAARSLQPGGAGAPGAQRQPRGALLDGGAVDRGGARRAPARHAGAIASRRARQDPVLRMSKRTIAVELATPGLDPQGRPARIPLAAGVGPLEQYGEPDAGEHMLIEITPRCTVLRVIACEMSRIISHMVWLGTTSIDLGAFTPFLWAFHERERIYNLQEMWTGARLTTSVTRVGGMMADITDDFVAG